MNEQLVAIIRDFSKLKVLVIGEATIDVSLIGMSGTVAREAPVPVVEVTQVQRAPGRASNAAVNVAQLGAETHFLSAIGSDEEGKNMLGILKNQQVRTNNILIDPDRHTQTVQRVIAGDHLLVRFDCGTQKGLGRRHQAQLIARLRRLYAQCDAVLVSDYGYGILQNAVIQELEKLQREHNKPLVIDSKHLDRFSRVGATAIKPNYKEAITLLGITNPEKSAKRAAQLQQCGEKLLELTGTQYAAVTLDIDGAVILQKGATPYRTYGHPVQNSKAVGAGDTYSAALLLALAADATIQTAAEIAQTAASIVVKKSGTVACHLNELLQSFSTDPKLIADWQELNAHVTRLKKQGQRIVFTNGCFDILHSGHVSYLNQAKAQGDVLIVALNTDESVQKLKGPERPINTLNERIRVMSGLHAVDIVTVFSQRTPLKLLEIIQPDIYVKGGDYTRATLPEAPLVESYGGQVAIMRFVENHSTTGLIAHIRNLADPTKEPNDANSQSLDPVY